MDNYNYPLGADNSNAPWNKEDNTETITVTVSITLSKDVEIEVDKHEDFYDYADHYLEEAVRKQINLTTIDTREWDEDDFSVNY